MSEDTRHPEIWKPIPGCEESYEVSDHGRVRSLDRIITDKTGVKRRWRGRMLALAANPSGHLNVSLGGAGTVWVHRLVLEAFVGPCPSGQECCHNDGNPANNHLTNLRWDSLAENRLDSVRHGTHRETAKTHCPRGHALSSPNLMPSEMRRGYRSCLACSRARSYIQKRPGMKHDLQQISDGYYHSIINTSSTEKEAS